MRRGSIRRGPRTWALLGGALAVALLAGCGDSAGTDPAVSDVEDLPADYVVDDPVFNVTLEGIRQAVLVGDTAYMHGDSSTIDLVRVNLRIFTETGRERATVVSKTGKLDMRTQAMIATGDVRVTTNDGRIITTQELHYDPENNRIWSDEPTTIVEGGQTTRGTRGFTANADFTNLQIRGASAEGLKVEF